MSYRKLGVLWVLLAAAMSANGALRELVLKRTFSDSWAELISAALGAVVILLGTRLFFHRLPVSPPSALYRASAFLIVLTVAFEFLIGHYVDRKTWGELSADYAIWRGQLWPVLLALIAITPFLWGRWLRPLLTPGKEIP